MTRAEKRRIARDESKRESTLTGKLALMEKNKNETYTLSYDQLEKMCKHISDKKTYALIRGCRQVMSYILMKDFGFGAKRLERFMISFTDLCNEVAKDSDKHEEIRFWLRLKGVEMEKIEEVTNV